MFALNAFWQINYQSIRYDIHHLHQDPVNTTGEEVSFPLIIKHMGYKNHFLYLVLTCVVGLIEFEI